jgi:hypothetical protein
MERRYRLWRWRCRAAALLCTCISAHAVAAAEVDPPQHMAYRVAWNGIPAAHAAIDVTRDQQAGTPGYTISARAFTNQFIDLFWRYRGNASTTLLDEPVRPLRFSYERRVNSTPTLTWIDFSPHAQRARSGYIKRAQRHENDIDTSGLVDPITAGFHALTASARVGDTLSYRVFTGEDHYRVRLMIRAEETVDVPAGRFEALRVEPEVIKIKEKEEVDKRVRRATIWVTRAPMRTILRIRSEIFIGVITLDLVQMDQAR